jgi:hypothetical protein
MRLPLLTKLCTNAEIDLFDHNKLGDSGMTVKRLEAIHKGLGTKTADKDEPKAFWLRPIIVSDHCATVYERIMAWSTTV